MTNGPADKVWFMARLDLKNVRTGATQIFRLSSRSAPGADDYLLPILRSVSGFGPISRAELPDQTRGVIVIDNAPQSIGFERKFSDILNQYAAIRQQLILYSALTKRGDVNPTFTELWRGNISGVRQSFGGDNATLSIDVARADLPNHVVTKTITPLEFPSAPSKSLGKTLSLVFGTNREHEAHWIDNGTIASDSVFGTCFADDFTIDPFAASLAFKDASGNAGVVTGASAIDTAFYAIPGSGAIEIASPQETGPVLAGGVLQDKVLTSVRFVGVGTNIGTYEVGNESEFIISVYEMRKNSVVGPRITSGRRRKFDYLAAIRASGTFNIDISLDSALPMINPLGYLVTVDQSNEAGLNDPSILGDFVELARNDVEFSVKAKNFGTVGVSGVELWTDYPEFAGLRACPRMSFFGATINISSTIYSINNVGLSSRRARFEQRTLSGIANSLLPSFQSLQPFVVSSGLRDNTSGDITGTPHALLSRPEHIADLLTRKWNGSSWSQDLLDKTKFADTHQGDRLISGSTQGSQKAKDVLAQVLGNSLTRITSWNNPGANTNLGIAYLGARRSVTNFIDDEDITLSQIEIAGTETVINRAIIFYDRKLITTTPEFYAAEGSFRNFGNFIDSNEAIPDKAAQSVALYGEAPLRSNQFNFLSDDQAVRAILELFVSLYQHPHIFVSFDVPFAKYQGAIDIYDELYISHPDFPSFYGSTSSAKLPLSGVEDQEIEPSPGAFYKRAQGYFATVEGYENTFSIDGGPKIRIGARLLI